jgi:hypothetical protein
MGSRRSWEVGGRGKLGSWSLQQPRTVLLGAALGCCGRRAHGGEDTDVLLAALQDREIGERELREGPVEEDGVHRRLRGRSLRLGEDRDGRPTGRLTVDRGSVGPLPSRGSQPPPAARPRMPPHHGIPTGLHVRHVRHFVACRAHSTAQHVAAQRVTWNPSMVLMSTWRAASEPSALENSSWSSLTWEEGRRRTNSRARGSLCFSAIRTLRLPPAPLRRVGADEGY